MSEMLDKLEINAESALDFDDTTLVVPMTLVREMFDRLEAENAELKREKLKLNTESFMLRQFVFTEVGRAQFHQLMSDVEDALLTAEESE